MAKKSEANKPTNTTSQQTSDSTNGSVSKTTFESRLVEQVALAILADLISMNIDGAMPWTDLFPSGLGLEENEDFAEAVDKELELMAQFCLEKSEKLEPKDIDRFDFDIISKKDNRMTKVLILRRFVAGKGEHLEIAPENATPFELRPIGNKRWEVALHQEGKHNVTSQFVLDGD